MRKMAGLPTDRQRHRIDFKLSQLAGDATKLRRRKDASSKALFVVPIRNSLPLIPFVLRLLESASNLYGLEECPQIVLRPLLKIAAGDSRR